MQEDIQHQEEPLRLLAKRQNSSLSIEIEKEYDMEGFDFWSVMYFQLFRV